MRNLLPYRFLIFICIISASFGCALRVNVPITIPASAGEVLEFRRVAVFDFQTDSSNGNRAGNAYTSAIETEIEGVTLNGKKIFTVLDRQNIDKILKEQKFQMTVADVDSIVEAGKLLGASGIWTGTASENYNASSWYESELYCAAYDNKSCIRYETNYYKCISQEMALNVTPKLTDVATGKIVYTNKFTGRSDFRSCKYDVNGVNRGGLWEKAMRDILNQFRKEIAPYIKIISVKLMDSTKGIEDKNAEHFFKDGIKYMKKKDIAGACVLWRKSLDTAGNSVSLNYNVAICDEIGDNYSGALKKLNIAKKNFEKNNKLIEEAIERNNLNIKYQKIVQEQLSK